MNEKVLNLTSKIIIKYLINILKTKLHNFKEALIYLKLLFNFMNRLMIK